MKKWGIRKENQVNPIHVKLVVFFVLSGVTIYLLASRSIDYSASDFSIAINSRHSEPLTSDKVLKNQTSPANEPQGVESVIVDEGNITSNSTELHEDEAIPTNSTELYEDETGPSNATKSDEGNAKPSSSTELNEDETGPSNSTELNDNEAKPSNTTEVFIEKTFSSAELNEHEPEPSNSTSVIKLESSNSTELDEDDAEPSNSTELNKDEAKPSNATQVIIVDESNSTELNKAEPSFSTEVDETEEKPSSSTELKVDEGKPSNSTELKIAEPAKSTESPTDEVKPKCDLFKGDWIPDPLGPSYNNKTCAYIEPYQDCLTNGRPDTGFLFWRWKPRDCELPKFNPRKLLDLVRNRSWAFIGDSIARNHVQSLLCMLSKVEPPKEIYHDEKFKSRTWYFPSYNFTVSVIWSPFIAKADMVEYDDGVGTSEILLHLDKLNEEWTSQYKDFDYVTIAGGKWYMRPAIYLENNKVQGCHYCPGKNLTDIGFDIAYRKVIQNLFNFVSSSSHKPTVFFRPLTPDHFENGEWHNGGTCTRKVPFKDGETYLSDVDKILHEVEMQEFNKVMYEGSETIPNLKLLYTTHLSLLRPDGHPGPYRNFQPFAKGEKKVVIDCLHWCLPGPIDSWNDLILEILMTG